MKISDRDKKLILFVLLIAIIALPIVFFIKPRIEKTKALDEELVSLNERYNFLKTLADKQENYEKEIVRLNAERDNLISGFAGGILKENTIMYLRGIELSDFSVRFNTISFVEPEETVVTEAKVVDNELVDGLTAVKDSATILYHGSYDHCKQMIAYIFSNKEKIGLSTITMELDPSNNEIKGTLVFDQYAILGNGKEVIQADIPTIELGVDRLFDVMLDQDGNPKVPDGQTPEEAGEEENNTEE